jgi:magnesium-transporting ATPase (P-type)
VHNVAQLVPYLAFILLKIPLPLTPIQALSIDLGTDTLPSLGLGIERPDPQTMLLPPRAKGERLLNLPLALRAYFFLGGLEATAAMAAFFFVLFRGGWTYGHDLDANDPLYLSATTACLAAIIVMQIVNVFICRSSVRSTLTTGLIDNRLITWGVAVEVVLLLLIVYTPLGHFVLGTAPVSSELWIFLLPFVITMLTLEEARKWFARRTLSKDKANARPLIRVARRGRRRLDGD